MGSSTSRRYLAHGLLAGSTLLIAVAPAGARAEIRDLSLLQALSETYDSNPRLLAARARLRQNDEAVPEALAGWRPHVTLEGRIGPGLYQNRLDTLHYPEHRTPQDYELTVTQTLYASGRVSDALAQARARVLAQRSMLAAAEAQALLAAASAYLDVVRDREILALEHKQEAVLARTLRANTVELAAGNIAQSDLSQSEARLSRQRATRAAAVAQLAGSAALFEQAVGVQPGQLALPRSDLPMPSTEAEALRRAMAANPDLLAARHTMEASRLGIDRARDELLPQITLNGLIQRQRQYEYDLYSQSVNAVQALVQVTVPLYQGGAEYARIREAKQGNIEAQDLVEQAARDATRAVRTGWASLLAARDRIGDSAQATRADRIAEIGLAEQQQVGARTTIDLLNAQQETLTSEVSEITARTDLLQAELMLLDVTGGLTLQHLGMGQPGYDPNAHYREVHAQWAGETPPHDDQILPRKAPRPGDIGH